MRVSKAARGAPAIDAARDPENDLLADKIDRTRNPFDGIGQAVILAHDPGLSGATAFYFASVDRLTVDDNPAVGTELDAATFAALIPDRTGKR
jgi:hypothetical protein